MKSNLPIFLCLTFFACLVLSTEVIAQVGFPEFSPASSGRDLPLSGGVPAATSADANALLKEAISLLKSRHSIAAAVSYEVDLLGWQFTGKGEYREQRGPGPQPQVRLDLKIPLDEQGGQIGTLVQVCDGRALWTYRQLLDAGKLTRVDLDRVAKLVGPPSDVAPLSTTTGPIGAGGLAGLLQCLERHFVFEPLASTSTELGMPVWRLRGGWRPETLARLLPDQREALQKGQPADLAKLPEHLPDHVVLLLGQGDLFPYRIEYRRTTPDDRSGSGAAASRAIVAMSLPISTVQVNVPIDPAHFQYGRSDIEPVDETQRFIQAVQDSRPAKAAEASHGGPRS